MADVAGSQSAFEVIADVDSVLSDLAIHVAPELTVSVESVYVLVSTFTEAAEHLSDLSSVNQQGLRVHLARTALSLLHVYPHLQCPSSDLAMSIRRAFGPSTRQRAIREMQELLPHLKILIWYPPPLVSSERFIRAVRALLGFSMKARSAFLRQLICRLYMHSTFYDAAVQVEKTKAIALCLQSHVRMLMTCRAMFSSFRS